MPPSELAVRVVRPDHEEYPRMLEPLKARPERLFVRGRCLGEFGPTVAIVGSRAATSYGRDVARTLAGDLAAAGVCVVSGMARGIDAEAHRGALDAGGSTIAVLAAGVDRPYPPGNASLFRRILETNTVVSEHSDGENFKRLFPERNRVIAGMSLAVVVVQGVAGKTGTKSTVDWAAEYGRQVFAVPGDVRSDRSSFPHALLRDGAAICASPDDVIAHLRIAAPLHGVRLPAGSTEHLNLTDGEREVYEAVAAEPGSAEAIAQRCDLDPAAVLLALGRMEIRGLLRRSSDGAYLRR